MIRDDGLALWKNKNGLQSKQKKAAVKLQASANNVV